jgi:hypothetical protein
MKPALKGCNTKATVQSHQSKDSNSKAAFLEVSIEGLQYKGNSQSHQSKSSNSKTTIKGKAVIQR